MVTLLNLVVTIYMQKNNRIPKKIFFLWLQGIDEAPIIVQQCYKSWIKYNPDWEIILLSKQNLENYINLTNILNSKSEITPQALSDIIRINLLNKYGGVWTDATCFCTKPLDSWLPKYSKNGFFAFNQPGPDRPISSWFLASTKNNLITQKWCTETNNYWTYNKLHPASKLQKIDNYFLKNFTNTAIQTKIWFNFITRKILKIYPYFWFHYLFTKILKKNNDIYALWENTKKYSANIPHTLLHDGLFTPPSYVTVNSIKQIKAPLYKLSYKNMQKKIDKNSTLMTLLQKHNIE